MPGTGIVGLNKHADVPMTLNVPGKRASRHPFRQFRKVNARAPANGNLPYPDDGAQAWDWSTANDSSFASSGGTAAGGMNGQPMAGIGAPPSGPLGGRWKRLMDMVLALVVLVLASPIMIMAAIAIRLSTGGPALYAHERVGFDGKPFQCYKFRSMVANSDEVLRDYLAANPEAAKQWQDNRKLKCDPRITVLGLLMRKSSIDELPQLFNVLKGEMSCVGPRPIVREELGRYGNNAGDYLSARPGLTGLWQVTGRSSTDYAKRVALDSSYVRNWSLGTDLSILWKTVFAVIRFDQAS